MNFLSLAGPIGESPPTRKQSVARKSMKWFKAIKGFGRVTSFRNFRSDQIYEWKSGLTHFLPNCCKPLDHAGQNNPCFILQTSNAFHIPMPNNRIKSLLLSVSQAKLEFCILKWSLNNLTQHQSNHVNKTI